MSLCLPEPPTRPVIVPSDQDGAPRAMSVYHVHYSDGNEQFSAVVIACSENAAIRCLRRTHSDGFEYDAELIGVVTNMDKMEERVVLDEGRFTKRKDCRHAITTSVRSRAALSRRSTCASAAPKNSSTPCAITALVDSTRGFWREVLRQAQEIACQLSFFVTN